MAKNTGKEYEKLSLEVVYSTEMLSHVCSVQAFNIDTID